MSLFERWLTLWVALCIVAGVGLGWLLPDLFGATLASRRRVGRGAGHAVRRLDREPHPGMV